MRFRIPLGRILGVRVGLHPSWFVILLLVAWASAAQYAAEDVALSRPVASGMGVATALLFFASLLAHELGHAVVARRLGVPVRGITLFLLGGVAEISQEIRTAGREFVVAAVGPGVSLALAAAFGLVAFATDAVPAAPIAATLAAANALLAAFNLIPGLPLDGGRILRAGVWRATGDYRRATRVGVVGGRLVALALLVLGAVLLLTGSAVGAWYLVVALFLDEAARRAGRQRGADSPEHEQDRTEGGVALSPDEEAPAG